LVRSRGQFGFGAATVGAGQVAQGGDTGSRELPRRCAYHRHTVNGQAATTTALSNVIEAKKPGQVVSLTVSTEAGIETIQVRLAQAPVDFELSVQL
jgi:hypothetical protein